uniref:Alpha-type protein kinase domain-containing protein n=1 Tax=Coccidioides posadasii RMSCC 3488 TaxID=454284 RepID=A0A0J6FHS4_COCPO|nr:hypothetical protein CPAG_05248 [Coccidioides posadasii RMSCC 3488]
MGWPCTSCDHHLSQSSYTTNQYSKGPGVLQCASCVHSHPSDNSFTKQSDSGRYNISTHATVPHDALDNLFAQGAFCWVAKGKYTSGLCSGQVCVIKWFKTGAVFSDNYFTLDIKAIDKVLEIVNRFNQLDIITKVVKINITAVWVFKDNTSDKWAGQNNLCESFIQNYQKFNSNSGWNDGSQEWGKVMQALSHFSYHLSGGNYVLCDLQGGVYQHEVVLSDPVILLWNQEYGVTDLGSDEISSFFSQHKCNNYCHPTWTQPAHPVQHFHPVPGTIMI